MAIVRRAEPKDAGALAAFAESSFRATFGASNSRENMDAHCAGAFGEAIQAAEIVDPAIETFVGEDRAELVGYAQLRWGASPPCVAAARPAEVQRIYVDPRWQGQGLAGMFMDRLLDAATQGGADAVWLGVWEHNPKAVAFYRKYGFDRVGHHVFRLGDDPQHDWILCRGVPRSRPDT
jgi:ribosomal protein S18 acetylase RimI-like enzyme